MKFSRVSIENFMAIGRARVDLADRGLLLIQGENRDDPSANSNGSGKSTVVEALCWALYGKTAKGVNGDGVVNRVAGKGTLVEVMIEDGGVVYGIKRHRKHKTGKNGLEVWSYEKDADRASPLTKGTEKLTQELVETIVGCSHEVFVAAVYAGQEKLPDLPAMTDKELKLLIEEAAGITLLERAYDIARARHATAERAVEEMSAGLELQNTRNAALAERIKDARIAEKRWYAERDARVIDLETEARTYIADAKAQKALLEARPKKAELERKLAVVVAKLDGLKGEKVELDRRQAELSRAESIAAAKRATAENAVAQLKRARASLERIKGGIGEPCSECGRPHDEATLCRAIETAESTVAATERDARESVEAAKAAQGSCKSLAERLEAFKRSMTDASASSDERAIYTRAVSEIEAIEANIERAADLARRRVEAVKREKAAENPSTGKVAELELEAKEGVAKAKVMKTRLDEKRQHAAIVNSCVRVFSPKGVRAHILDTVTPYLNDRTAHYLGSLADGRIEAIWQTLTPTAKGELREKFSISVQHADGGSEFAALSGGEKRKVRLACAMALQDLVATRATKPIGLWIADEVDAALDVSGLERLMNVLEDKARERGTVLVISHSDLTDWVRESITVVKEKGLSHVA